MSKRRAAPRRRELDWRERLIAKWMPEGWSLEIDEELRGRGECQPVGRKVRMQRFNNSAEDKLIFWHEVGHIVCGHMENIKILKHLEEYEAEQFALFAAKLEGILVPALWLADAKANVRDAFRGDQSERENMNTHVLHWVTDE